MAGTSSMHRHEQRFTLYRLENYIERYREKKSIKIALDIKKLLRCELHGTCLVNDHFLLCASNSTLQSEIQDDYHKVSVGALKLFGSIPSCLPQREPVITFTPTTRMPWNPNSRDGRLLKFQR
jgi:hypothetical protein